MIEREKQTVSKMIGLYCRLNHSQKTLCDDCRSVELYAHNRLDNCTFGSAKPSCKKCTVHCYKLEYREKIRAIMRFSGPRMLFFYPREAIWHINNL